MDYMKNETDVNSPMEGANNTDYYNDLFIELRYLHFFFMVLTAAEIVADILIIVVILRHKFWKVPAYVLILNWTIFDLLRLFTSPVVAATVLRISPSAVYPYLFVNISFNMACLFGIVVTLLVLILSQIRFFKVHYVKFIVVSWIVVAILVATYIAAAFAVNVAIEGEEEEAINKPMEILFSAVIFFYFIGVVFIGAYIPLLIVVLITCIIYWIKKSYKKNTVAKLKLILGTTYMCYWLATIFSVVILTLCQYYYHYVVQADLLLFYILMETNSLANLFILQLTDKRFKLYLFNLFRCSTNKYEPDMTFDTYETEENLIQS